MRKDNHAMAAKSALRSVRQAYLAWLVLLVGMVLTGLVWHTVFGWEKETARHEFDIHVKDTIDAVQQRLDVYANILYGARALFAASDEVTRDEWRRYTALAALGEHHPGVHTFAFVRHVSPQEKTRFEKRVRADTSVNRAGYPDFAISPPGQRDDYFPIEYIEPETRYSYLLGVDRGAAPDTRATLERARDSGLPATCGRLHSEVENLEASRFFLMMLPVYRNDANPVTVAERRAALLGFVTARVELDTLLKGVVGSGVLEELFFELYDGGDGGAGAPKTPQMTRENLLFAVDGDKTLYAAAATPAERFTRRAGVEAYGRDWQFYFGSRAGFSPVGGYLPAVVLLGGAVSSVLAFALVLSLVTQRRRVMNEIVRQKSLFSQVMDALPVNIFLKDKDFRFALVNEETAQTLGTAKETVIGKTDFELFPHEVAAALREHDEQARIAGQLVMREERLISNGQERYMLAGKKNLYLPDSREPMLLGFSIDVTERRRLEQEAARGKANELSRSLANAVGVGLIGVDLSHRVVFANPKAQTILGIAEAEMLGKLLDEVVQAMAADGGRLSNDTCPAWRMISDGRAFQADDWSFCAGDGNCLPVSVVIAPLYDKGEISGAVLSFQDITQRKEAEIALRETERRQAAILDNIPELAWLKDSESRYIAVNEPCAQACGLSAAEVVGKSDLDFWPPEIAELYRRDDLEVMTSRRRKQVAEPLVTQDGKNIWIETIKTPIIDGQGQVVGTVGTARDITARRAAEEALTHHMAELARVNAELDEFTYVASHDLQEPVRKLVAFSDLLRKDIGGDLPPRAEQDLVFIVDASLRMQRLVRDLLSLSRTGKVSMVREKVALDEAVAQALEALELRVAESGATISRVPLPSVSGDLTLLSQLYQNLIGNALKFVAGHRPEIALTAEQVDGTWVFGVRDNGIGISPQYQDHIFQPFKRLHGREQYEGSGVGLSICRKVVERHRGRIWVESEEDQGAHFRFTLGKGQ